MKYIEKAIFFFIKSILKSFSYRKKGDLEFIQRVVDYGNNLLGKGSLGIQNKKEIEFVSKFINEKPKIIIDVGAHEGKYSEELLKNFDIEKLYLFEPSKHSFGELVKKFQNNKNITLVNKGLSDVGGCISLYAPEPGSIFSSIYKRRLDHFNVQFSKKEKVEMISFDSFYKTKLNNKVIDLLKLDVEGNELPALEGLSESIENIKIIQFEFGGSNIDSRTYLQDFYYFFNKHNFNIYRMRPYGLTILNHYKENDEVFRYSNFLALNSKFYNKY
ncbi:MAG: hypothetical protein CBD44_01125 [Flavobacteriaceae bacterium TMED184]|nr:MAG: hypothetical protein CBD44_01125 [Flavobacteriaceae bacterium TMED184]